MPCDESRSVNPREIEELKKEFIHNSPVAEMLCKIISHIGMENIENCLNTYEPIEFMQELNKWWELHRKRDMKRIADELKDKVNVAANKYMKSLPSNERKLIENHIEIEVQVFPSGTYKRKIEE